MALHNTISHVKDLLHRIQHDIGKAEHGNKAAAQRVRTNTVKLEKIAKTYRKESISNEKQNKGQRRPAKKAASKSKPKAHAKPKTAHKAKKALARPRALSFKRPTARLPFKRA